MRKKERERQLHELQGADHVAGGVAVADECAAFLSGNLAELWEERGIEVPVWAWTNLLAHGSEARIAETIARPARGRQTARGWKLARSYLAYEVLDLVDDLFPLSLMQATILVPLELELSGRPAVSRWSLTRWVDTVDLAIRNEPVILDE